MRQLSIVLSVGEANIYQTIILEDSAVHTDDFIKCLNTGEYITTIGHDRCFDDEDFMDVEVLDKNLKRVGYVKEQSVDKHTDLTNFELMDEVEL